MKKYLVVLLVVIVSQSINAQINVIDFQCVSPPVNGGSLRLTLDANISFIPSTLFMTIEDCNGESITSNSTFEEENNSFSSFVYFPGTNLGRGGCDDNFSGSISLYNPNVSFIDANILDGKVINDILPQSASVSHCNSYFKDVIRTAVYDGSLQFDPCNPWLGECGTEGLAWRQGKVSIGEDMVPPGDVMLSVKGVAFTEEFKTCDENITWCDYVFEDNYILKPLSDVENVIKNKKRLHGMPSEADIIKNNGFEVTDMIIRQQEKIEELFLHTIEISKKIDFLVQKNETKVPVVEVKRYNQQRIKEEPPFLPNSAPLPPPDATICEAIDCETLLNDNSTQFKEYVLGELQSSSCKKWEGPCLNSSPSFGEIRARSGKVGIGTNDVPSGFNMAINGMMRVNDLKVFLCEGSWCDYVFDDSYRLSSLSEVDKFIEKNKRLPNVPSSSELLEDRGLLLKEITIIQQEKIEELFLYMIALKKKIINLKSK